jgi:histidinol-phosphate phosphatase family protein
MNMKGIERMARSSNGTAAGRTGMSDALGRIEAFVLAGGMETRLRAAVPDHQKVVAPVAGYPVLARVLDQLADAGLRHVVIGVGQRAAQVRAAFGETHGPIRLTYSEEPEPLGTAGALRHARFRLSSDPVLVLNGESYVETNLAAFLAWHRARGAAASILLATASDSSRYETVETDARGRVPAFREKTPCDPGRGSAQRSGPVSINAGIYLLKRSVIDRLAEVRPLSLEHEVFPSLVGAGLYGYRGGSGMERAPDPSVRPFVVLDRDGTLIVERHHLSEPEGVALLPGVVEGLRSLRSAGFRLVVATNQAGVGRGYFQEARVAEVHARLVELLAREGVLLDGIFYCPHHPDAGCDCRKPATGLVRQAAAALGAGAAAAAVIGDKRSDIDLARALGTPAVLVTTGYGAQELATGSAEPDYVVDSLAEAAAVLHRSSPTAPAEPAPIQ